WRCAALPCPRRRSSRPPVAGHGEHVIHDLVEAVEVGRRNVLALDTHAERLVEEQQQFDEAEAAEDAVLQERLVVIAADEALGIAEVIVVVEPVDQGFAYCW